MAVRSDISVDWVLSPRIITVGKPSTSLQLQDLVDTCRDREDDIYSLQYPHLINAAGKEDLGGGVAVGITVILQNAKVAFEARPASGGFVQCTISGGNLVAHDASGNTMDPIQTTNYTQVIMAQASQSTIVETGTSGLTAAESTQLFALPRINKIIGAILALLR